MALERVALIGTGLMGKPMARAIARAGFDPAVWNRTPAHARELAQEGITVADTVTAAVTGRSVVVIMVSNAAAVDDVLFGGRPHEKDCVSEAAEPGTTVIVMSSIAVNAAREQA